MHAAGLELGAEAARRPRGLRGRSARAPPLRASERRGTTRRPPASPRRRRGRRLRRRSRRRPTRLPGVRSRGVRRARRARCRAASARARPAGRLATSRWTTPTAAEPCAAATSRSTITRADLPAPARDAVGQVERGEQLVPARVDGAVAPLVGREPDARVADDEHRVERRQAEHAARRPVDGDDEQAVVATGAQARRPCPLRSRPSPSATSHSRAVAASRSPHGCGPKRISSPCRRHELADRRHRHAARPQDQLRDEPGPAGLVAGAEPGAVVAVEVLEEQQVVLPRGIGLEPLDPAEARPPAVLADEEQRDQPVADVVGDLDQRVLAALSPSGTRSCSSSPKKRA